MLLRSNAYRKALLQQFTGAAAGYSLRGLDVPYILGKLPVLRVRRSNDDDERDLTWWEITDGTLTAWTGAGDGFVRTWYDQSGNARHAEQATPGGQAKIVSDGVLVKSNGKTALDFAASLRYYPVSVPGDILSIFALSEKDNSGLVSADLYYETRSTQVVWRSNAFNAHAVGTSTYALDSAVAVGTTNPRSVSVWRNGVASTSNPVSLNALKNADALFARNIANNTPFSKKIQELILYPSSQSTNRADIEANINAAWEVY